MKYFTTFSPGLLQKPLLFYLYAAGFSGSVFCKGDYGGSLASGSQISKLICLDNVWFAGSDKRSVTAGDFVIESFGLTDLHGQRSGRQFDHRGGDFDLTGFCDTVCFG